MAFGVVSGIGRGMGVLDGGGDRLREGAVLRVNVAHRKKLRFSIVVPYELYDLGKVPEFY